MAYLRKSTRTLFCTTSPRSPSRITPIVTFLVDNFDGELWNTETQEAFARLLAKQDFYEGAVDQRNPALSARDLINRAPKALGLVDLKPFVRLTTAGKEYTMGHFPEKTLLKQLLKFQLPSPYHMLPQNCDLDFFVRPYLEVLRLIRYFGTLSFDELMLFGMQLTNYRKFSEIVSKIERFRIERAKHEGSYRSFFHKACGSEVEQIYRHEIQSGRIAVRESARQSLAHLIKTKTANMRDYADACSRYLRATEIVSISQHGRSLSISRGRLDEVDYILETVPREPVFIDDEAAYKEYLFDYSNLRLLSDSRAFLAAKIQAIDPAVDTAALSLGDLKDRELELRLQKRTEHLEEQISRIKDYREYDNIQETFDGIIGKKFYEPPLMFEWNVWRAMTMIDGGAVTGGFKLDDEGLPLSTAPGNEADVVCDYGSFHLAVEVTLQSGSKQYDNEGEPVARHLGNIKREVRQDAFCLFIAPKIHEATIAYFYMLHKTQIRHYGGLSVIVPLELAVFRKMLESTYKCGYEPSPEHVRALFDSSVEFADKAGDESEWYVALREYALRWPASAADA